MLAIGFLFPLLLGAAAVAAAAPIIIHFILRTKPRRIPFPALRFVRKTHQANISKLRLKHLILMAMRIALILLIGAMLARARTESQVPGVDADRPTAAVIVIDNSGSMGYRAQDKTRLDRAREQADQVIQSLPAGSRIAVLASEQPEAGSALLSDRKLLSQQVVDVQPGFGDRPLAEGIRHAVSLLRSSELPRRRIFVLTDGTARPWRVAPSLPADLAVEVVVLAPDEPAEANQTVAPVELSARSVPVGAEVWVESAILSKRLGGDVPVRILLDGQPVLERSVRVQAGADVPIRLPIPAERTGMLRGELRAQTGDPLAADDTRYFTLHVTEPARVVMVREAGSDRTRALMALAAAPTAAGAGGTGGGVRLETVRAGELTRQRLEGAAVAMLADVGSLSVGQWGMLGEFVRRGGWVWVVAGPSMAAGVDGYNSPEAQQILPLAPGGLVALAAPTPIRDVLARDPLLAPFRGERNPPLTEIRASRRFAVRSMSAEAVVLARYADGTAALARRDVGTGGVVFWNVSPLGGQSNLARLEQLPVLAQHTLSHMLAGDRPRLDVDWGQTVLVSAPSAMRAPRASVAVPGGGELPLLTQAGSRQVEVHADRLGAWVVRFSEAGQTRQRGFAVNMPAAESDLGGIAPLEVAALFPEGSATVVASLDELTRHRQKVSEPVELAPLLLVALVVLLVAEGFFANRFYRSAEPSAGPQAGR